MSAQIPKPPLDAATYSQRADAADGHLLLCLLRRSDDTSHTRQGNPLPLLHLLDHGTHWQDGVQRATVPMHSLDDAVVQHLEHRILDPRRLSDLMEQLFDRRADWVERRRSHVGELRKRASEAEAKLQRLYEAIENGLIKLDDTSLKDRITELTAIRDQARSDAERAISAIERIGPSITRDNLIQMATAARRKLRKTDGSYRRDYLRPVAQRVEVVSKTEIAS